MNRTTIIIVAVVAVIAAGALIWTRTNTPMPKVPTETLAPETSSQETPPAEPEATGVAEEAADDMTETAEQTAQDVAASVENAADQAAETAETAASEASDSAAATVDSTQERVDEAVDAARQAAEEAVAATEETASDLASRAQEAANQATESVTAALDDATTSLNEIFAEGSRLQTALEEGGVLTADGFDYEAARSMIQQSELGAGIKTRATDLLTEIRDSPEMAAQKLSELREMLAQR